MIFRILVWLMMMVGGGALGLFLDRRWLPLLQRSVPFHALTLALGVPALWLVIRISRNTGRLLGREGREGDLPRGDTNRLVTEGVYGCMRHPMHLGLFFFPLSLALLIGSPTFILLIAPLEALFMLTMVKLMEEPEAIAKFGDAYREYQQRVPMFNLRPDCLRLLLRTPEL
ncbi:MAG TPA: isoprenylcysteine carboxylmethyltransferase family protein [Thermoflexia bacterium]|nr:isoprenylcysteine carboxylmethyltransferase family protein [Thermoflexia bacterium]